MASIGTHYILTAIGGAKAKGIDSKAQQYKACATFQIVGFDG